MLFKDALTAIVLPISLTPCFGSSLHQIITMFCKTLIVLRTIHRIYLPSVELMLFSELTIGFDPRYFVPLLHLPLASASKHCQKAGK